MKRGAGTIRLWGKLKLETQSELGIWKAEVEHLHGENHEVMANQNYKEADTVKNQKLGRLERMCGTAGGNKPVVNGK